VSRELRYFALALKGEKTNTYFFTVHRSIHQTLARNGDSWKRRVVRRIGLRPVRVECFDRGRNRRPNVKAVDPASYHVDGGA